VIIEPYRHWAHSSLWRNAPMAMLMIIAITAILATLTVVHRPD
jgi:hypothetical protein